MQENLRKTSNTISKIKSSAEFSYRPIFYRMDNAEDKVQLDQLIADTKITIHNEIIGQLEELIKSKSPEKKFKSEELETYISAHIGETNIDDYGIWVHYPWSNRLVHILDKEEFIEVRTNRNRNKITLEEQEVLRDKKVGVMGLSVGQSVALTLAMERVVGEINIADHDILELSNLNRIRTGVHTLNCPKTVAVAQEIAEIDPFIKVNCYHEGITEENIDDFLLKDGRLDLLIDECDGLDIKFLCRTKAKEYQMPVLMDTSDRGMIDVERFDLEPDRSIFHGLIDHMDTSKIKYAKTNEEKVPYVLAIIGWETISDKMKASMVEIESSVSTWPQLASAVAMGGGLACDVTRRILLDQFHDSGRYFVDVEEIITDKEAIKAKTDAQLETNEVEVMPELPSERHKSIGEDEMISLANHCQSVSQGAAGIFVSNEMVTNLVEKSLLAPTGGNSQPWKWLFHNNQLFLFHDKGMSTQFLDFKGYGAYVGLGAAAENLILEAHKNNLEARIETFPLKENRKLAARITFEPLLKAQPYDYLIGYINDRCTDRNIYDSEPVSKEVLKSLSDACSSIPGVKLHMITGADEVKAYGKILGRSDKLLLTTKKTHEEFMDEIRWDQEEVERTKSGVDLDTIDLTATEVAGFKVIKNWSVVKYLNKWGGGGTFEKLSKKCAESAYGLGMITVSDLNSSQFFDGGRAMQRLWLEATKHNVNVHPLCALNYMFIRMRQGNAEGMDDRMVKELTKLWSEHEKHFSDNGEIGVFFFRFFKGTNPKKRSLRKPIEDILIIR